MTEWQETKSLTSCKTINRALICDPKRTKDELFGGGFEEGCGMARIRQKVIKELRQFFNVKNGTKGKEQQFYRLP